MFCSSPCSTYFPNVDQLWWKAAISTTNASGWGHCILFEPPKLPSIREPETCGPNTLLCENPWAWGMPSMSSALGGCLAGHREVAFLCQQAPGHPSLRCRGRLSLTWKQSLLRAAAARPSPPSHHLCPVAAVIETGGGGQAKEEVTPKILGGVREF